LKSLPFLAVILLLVFVVFIDTFIGTTQPSDLPVYETSSSQAREALIALEIQHRELHPQTQAVLVMFSDFECPFCGSIAPDMQALREYYGTRVPVQYMHFPLTQIHPHAYDAARAAACADRQGVFWEYHDMLFASERLDRDALFSLAEKAGIAQDVFGLCMASTEIKTDVEEDIALGRMLGVSGTPTFFIVKDGAIKKLEGAYSFEQLVYEIESFE
jgi:protein-disulfide isomerase